MDDVTYTARLVSKLFTFDQFAPGGVLMVTIDLSTLSLMGTIAASSAASAWYVGRMLRSVEVNLSAKLAEHENDDQRVFEEHGLRLQRLEIHGFGFTGAGRDAVSNPLPDLPKPP